MAELVGIRSGTPIHLATSAGGLAGVGVVVNEVGWGGVLGYSQRDAEGDLVLGDQVLHSKVSGESLWLVPALDVFVGRRVSIGVATGLLWSRQRYSSNDTVYDDESVQVGVQPRVGYVMPLGHGISFWPRVGIGYAHGWYAVNVATSNAVYQSVNHAVSAALDLGLVYHPTPRLLFKVTPQIGVGRSVNEGGYYAGTGGQWQSGQGTWLRIGGEATAGLAF
ncbi:MAG: hypothetical protein R3B70_29465 [Polyangiaceae bacterium]